MIKKKNLESLKKNTTPLQKCRKKVPHLVVVKYFGVNKNPSLGGFYDCKY